MTRITTLTMSRGVLDDIARAQHKLSKTQQQLSSGQALNRPSDNPYLVGRALQLRSEMESAQSLQANVSEAQGWAEVTDTALATIGDALQRARELTVYGATDTTAGEPREQIATEIRGLIESIKTAANASYGGRYVFSGTATDTPPYAVGGSDAYQGNGDLIAREIGPNVTINVNTPGDAAIGDDTSGLLFQLRGIVTALENDDTAALSAAVGALDTEMNDLLAVRAQIGATYNRLEVASGRLLEYEGTTLKLLSETESTDMAKAMIDFSTQQAALTAGLKAGAQIVQTSLLDFLR